MATTLVDGAAGTPATARSGVGADERRIQLLYTVGSLTAVLVVWQIVGATVLSDAMPTPIEVVRGLVDDAHLYPRNVAATATAAAKGWLVGNVAAVVLASIAVAFPATERTVLRFAVATYSIPVIAVAPILAISFSGDVPRAALAGLAVFFTTLVGAVVGLRSADKRAIDVVRALGGGGLMALRKIRIRAALPAFFAALRISAPAAVLGTILGEFMGADRGLGQFLVAAKANLNDARVWGVAFVITAVAGLGFAAIALVGRLLTPWAPKGTGS